MRDEKMAKKKKGEKTKMNWEGLKQPVKSGVGFREPPQKTCVFRGPRVTTPKNLRFSGTPSNHPKNLRFSGTPSDAPRCFEHSCPYQFAWYMLA